MLRNQKRSVQEQQQQQQQATSRGAGSGDRMREEFGVLSRPRATSRQGRQEQFALSASANQQRPTSRDRQASQEDQEELEARWRQAAQMLSVGDDDGDIHYAGNNNDNYRRSRNSAPASGNSGSGRRTGDSGGRRSPFSSAPTSGAPEQVGAEGVSEDGREEEEEETNSSISFAQSGCHSILSAWRFKNRQRQAQSRATSVLSQAPSSVGRRSQAMSQRSAGKSPAALNLIPLGPKQAQHFVTNSRRRRRANELILSTLEARRRAFAAMRLSNANGSLLGSNSYLNEQVTGDHHHLFGDHSARLSLSPSPVGNPMGAKSPQTPLSDLGVSTAARAQRQRLLAQTAASIVQRTDKQAGGSAGAGAAAKKRPPLAKLDQNSSDLCSSNSSSSSSLSSSSSSSSSGSQFTQLVTSELAGAALLEGARLAPSRSDRQQQEQRPRERPLVAARRQPARPQQQQQQTPARQERRQQLASEQGGAARQRPRTPEGSADDTGAGKQLRRGALRRDSIRRLRLSSRPAQSPAAAAANQSSLDLSSSEAQHESSSESSNHRHQQYRRQTATSTATKTTESPTEPIKRPLPVARKLDIESNPFLNRHHFRSSSTRSSQAPAAPISASETRALQQQTNANNCSSAKPDRSSVASRQASHAQATRDDAEGIKQVERMLRQMSPNQVFSSRQSQVRQSKTSSVISGDTRQQQQQKGSDDIVITSGGSSKSGAVPIVRRVVAQSQQKQQQQQQQHQQLKQQKPKLVREGSSSRDDLTFDAMGNKRHFELAERWRKESRQLGPQSREERSSTERMEILRSTSISPPVAFRDFKREEQPRRSTTTSQAAAAAKPPVASKPAQRPSQQVRQTTASPVVSRTTQQQQLQLQRRAASEERQAADRQLAIRRTLRQQQQQQLQQQHQQDLPKFERTADDEFSKRVDYLRKLARANSSEPTSLAEKSKSANKPLTKPMTTNWRNQMSASSDSIKEKTMRAPLLAPRPAVQSASDKAVASTNLDALLAESGYQLRQPRPSEQQHPSSGSGGARAARWTRSNSSLASVGRAAAATPASTATMPSSRPTSPPVVSGQSLAPPQLLAAPQRPRELTSSAVVKLVVKEKSAPKLDYTTFAAPNQQPQQQPVVQRARLPTARSAAAPMRMTSPRSPEFGLAAASSNDDSAIASSVSSPSLSFMLNPTLSTSAATAAAAAAAPTTTTTMPQQPAGRDVSPPSRPPRANPRRVGQQQQQQQYQESGALQSILRRQQQQQSSPAGDSSDSSTGGPQFQPAAAPPPPPPQSAADAKRARQEPVGQEAPIADLRPLSASASVPEAGALALSQGQQQLAASGSPPKRVHFNDRTSIRSFESVSSLTESNPPLASDPQSSASSQSMNARILRHQLGSPTDSLGSGGSGASGRFSADSADGMRLLGAAIYAVRGDPELELQQDHQQHQHQPGQQAYMGGQFSYPRQQQQQQHNFIRMTAPPSISTGTQMCQPIHLLTQHQQQQHQQQQRSPLYLAAQQQPHGSPLLISAAAQRGGNATGDGEEDDDPDYALRLRQAATSRAFAGFGPAGAQLPAAQQQQQQQAQLASQRQAVAAARRQLDLLNFQTEV